MKTSLLRFDTWAIGFFQKISVPLARFSLFLVYFWFGILKVLGTSSANPLVAELQEKTLPFLSFDQFIILFGFLEMAIGLMFLIPKLDRLTIVIFFGHMVTTVMPLVLLPQVAWQGFMTPTMEGQYMIKNIVLIALVLSLGSRLKARTND